MKPYNTEQTKKEEVREMFDNIAPKYDLLNHTLSMSIDRIWRRRVVRIVRRCRPHRILDVATGTGDLAIEMARRIRGVQVLGVDLSEGMLDVARRKVTARGLDGRVVLDAGDAEHLHVADALVDVATVARSLYWSSRGPATGCSGRCTNSIPIRYCRASAAWCRRTSGLTNTSRRRSGSFRRRRSSWR